MLRFIVDVGGLYDFKKLNFKKISGVQYICSSSTPELGLCEIPSRLMRHFVVISLPDLHYDSAQAIFKPLAQ